MLANSLPETVVVMDSLDQLPPLRDILQRDGLFARRSLGQNFIMDMNLTDKIARLAGPLAGHEILEIGAGPGGLTRSLASAGAKRIVAIEKDSRFLPALQEIAEASAGLVEVIHADALEVDARELVAEPARIVANLPYNVGTELLTRWLSFPEWPPPWKSMTLTFQRELAQRLIAAPGSKAYGRLSVLVQWRTDATIAMTIPPTAFLPVPKISSAVVNMSILDSVRYPAEAHMLAKVVKAAFSQRRKMLRTSMRSLHPDMDRILQQCGIRPDLRADAVPIEDYCGIARALAGAFQLSNQN